MRIIAGDKRGLRLETLEGETTRPTMERVKEAIFSSIQLGLPGSNVLDLFAGSGQLGLEALSRGAARCTFVDENPEATDVVRRNGRHTGLLEQSIVLTLSAVAFLGQGKPQYDFIFLDPPYRSEYFPAILPAVSAVALPGAVVICETKPATPMPNEIAGLVLKKQYRYGTVLVSRYLRIE